MPATAALITALVLKRPTCLPCLSAKTGSTEPAIEGYLAVIGTTLTVERGSGRCSLCDIRRTTVSVGDPMEGLTNKA